MGKHLKKFDTHTEYETYIEGENVILPNVSYCDDNKDVHYNPIPPKATVRLTFTVSEPSRERISIAGDLSTFGGSTDADGLSKVETMRVDGVEVDMETAVTKENNLDMYGVVIDGYFYDFTESGQHTIEYILNDMTVNEGICCAIGNFTYQGLPFTSKISNASVKINADEIEGFSFAYSSSIESVTIGNSVTSIGDGAFYNCSSLASITSLATTAPAIESKTFLEIISYGTLTVPSGSSGYDVWMGTGDYYLGKYNWTKVEQ